MTHISYLQRVGVYSEPLSQALISCRTAFVGVVASGLSNPMHADLYGAPIGEMQARGFVPLTFQMTAEVDGPAAIASALASMEKFRVARIVPTSFAVQGDVLDACLASGRRVRLLDRADERGRTGAVSADVGQGGFLAARHLIATGRRIAILDGAAGAWTAVQRASGYLRGLEAAGLSPALRVPEDVAVIGFADIPQAAWTAFDMTGMRLPARADRGAPARGRASRSGERPRRARRQATLPRPVAGDLAAPGSGRPCRARYRALHVTRPRGGPDMPVPASDRVRKRRDALRAAGLRPVQIWVADARRPGFAARARARRRRRWAAADRADPELAADLVAGARGGHRLDVSAVPRGGWPGRDGP